MRPRFSRRGFTLIELLVVIAIITVMLALFLPAVQKVRAAADRMVCGNNLKQIGIALHHYELSYGAYPPSGYFPPGVTADAWSAQARLLPFIEQDNVHKNIDFGLGYAAQPLITQQRIPVYLCPTEDNDRPRPDGPITHYPLNYAVNLGTWHVYNAASGQGSDGAFSPSQTSPHGHLRPRDMYDGMSNTIAFAEVKAFTPYLRDSGNPAGPGAPVPTSPAEVVAFGGNFKQDSGHTEWVDARIHQTGFTTVFTPNTKVPYTVNGILYDVDFNSSREGKTIDKITYAAVTARSYHPGGVNVLFMDGSVRAIHNNISVTAWRALGTRNGGEVVSSDEME